MIAEATKLQYRGVLCMHCRQAIPLSPALVRKEKELRESEPNEATEHSSRSFNLRCRACHREATYTAMDVLDFDGEPRVRSSRRRSPLLKPDSKILSRAANG